MNYRGFTGTDCIRLKRGVCRIDLKQCRKNCPLRKTKIEQALYEFENSIMKYNYIYAKFQETISLLRKKLKALKKKII